MANEPKILRWDLLNCQICVPKTFTNEQAAEAANNEYHAGTQNGWVYNENHPNQRIQCDNDPEMVHVMLTC